MLFLSLLYLKMAPKHYVLAASCIFLCFKPLVDAFQCCGLLLCTLLHQRWWQQQLAVQAANECHAALVLLKHIQRRIVPVHTNTVLCFGWFSQAATCNRYTKVLYLKHDHLAYSTVSGS